MTIYNIVFGLSCKTMVNYFDRHCFGNTNTRHPAERADAFLNYVKENHIHGDRKVYEIESKINQSEKWKIVTPAIKSALNGPTPNETTLEYKSRKNSVLSADILEKIVDIRRGFILAEAKSLYLETLYLNPEYMYDLYQ